MHDTPSYQCVYFDYEFIISSSFKLTDFETLHKIPNSSFRLLTLLGIQQIRVTGYALPRVSMQLAETTKRADYQPISIFRIFSKVAFTNGFVSMSAQFKSVATFCAIVFLFRT